MVDNPLELGGGLYRLLRRQIRQAANVDRIELAEVPIEADAARGEVEAGGRLQRLNRRCRITCVQCVQGPQRRQIHELHRRVLRKVAGETVGQRARSRHITGHGERERGGIVHLVAPAERQGRGDLLSGGCRIPVQRFPHGGCRFEQRGPLEPPGLLRDGGGDRGCPPRVLQSGGASQAQRLKMRDQVFLGATGSGDRRLLTHAFAVVAQESDEVANQEIVKGKLALFRSTDGGLGRVQAIQVEFAERLTVV